MPSYYLLKSEPDEYSIQRLKSDKTGEWDGVRNYAARNHLQRMNVGDRCFFYHSSCPVPAIVGTCTVARTAQPDPTFGGGGNDDDKNKNPWVSVLVEFESSWDDDDDDNAQQQIITLKELKHQASSNPVIADMTLLKQSRLSVMPVSAEQWNAVFDLKQRKRNGEDLLQSSDNAMMMMTTSQDDQKGNRTGTRQSKHLTKDDSDNKRNNGKTKKRPRGSDTATDQDESHVIGDTTKTSVKKKTMEGKSAPSTTSASTPTEISTDINNAAYCSVPSEALTNEQVQCILSSSSDHATKGNSLVSSISTITEKELGLTGRKFMYKVAVPDEDGSPSSGGDSTKMLLVFHFDGTKFVGKDKQRLDSMIDAVKAKMVASVDSSSSSSKNKKDHYATPRIYLLLSPSSGICRRYTLPALLNDGVIVQRVQG